MKYIEKLHCPNCGNPMHEIGLGYFECIKCKTNVLPSVTPENIVELSVILPDQKQ